MKFILKSKDFAHEEPDAMITEILKKKSDYIDRIRDSHEIELIWDGSDLNVFIAAIEAAKYGNKQITMLSPYVDAPIKIASYKDVYTVLAPERSNRIPFRSTIPKEVREKVQKRCVESKDILQALDDDDAISCWGLMSLVACSVIPLQEKLEYLEEYLVYEDLFRDVLDEVCSSTNVKTCGTPPHVCYEFVLLRSARRYVEEARDALRSLDLKEGEILILSEKAYPHTVDGLGYDYGILPQGFSLGHTIADGEDRNYSA